MHLPTHSLQRLIRRVRRRYFARRRRAAGGGPRSAALWLVAATPVVLSGCGPDGDASRVDARARVVNLPGAARQIDFDDIVYSPRLHRILVPARRSGLYIVEPDSGKARRVGRLARADSADEGRGLVFILRREDRAIDVLDPASGRVVASANTTAPGDYVRYVASTDELWVTQPSLSPPGVEIFTVPRGGAPTPHRAGFIAVPGGAEGFATSRSTNAYVHSGNDLVRLDTRSRTVTGRWPTGCDGTHGFPRVDDRDGRVLASCAAHGEVVLLDAHDGHQLGRYVAGGGEALPAYSTATDHFYVRADPGTTLATLTASTKGLKRVSDVKVPEVGHCLTADSLGHYWTCDSAAGRILRFDDP